MRYGRALLMLFTALVLSGIVWIAARQGAQIPREPRLWLRVSGEEGSQRIACWADPAGGYYGFLPSYADLEQVTLEPERGTALTLNGQAVENGMSCRGLSLDTAYPAAFTTEAGRLDTTLTLLRSANVPAMYIDTQSGSMDYIHETKGNAEPGRMRLYSGEGALEYDGQFQTLGGRGNSTWLPDKKPYNLTLAYEADLLGMGAAQNWILLANSYDGSNLRNKLVYDFAELAGLAYSPACQWVDLYLNGEYAGLYLLCTRSEVHAQRVDISRTDSFLVSMELGERMQEQQIDHVQSRNSRVLAFRVHHAGMSAQELEGKLRAMENAILAPDGIDPETGAHYQDLIDLDSWAMRYLVDELFGNFDGGALSQFFYYDGTADAKICAGHVWDMDNCLGRGGYPANSIWAGRPHLWEEADRPLFYNLLQKEAFYQRVLELYEQVFRPMAQELLDGKLEEYAGRIRQAGLLNEARWNSGDMLEEVEVIRNFLEGRLAFFDDYYFSDTRYCVVQEMDPGGIWRCFAVPYGQSLSWSYYYMDTEEGVYLGYYDQATDAPFDVDQPLYTDVNIYPKWRYYWEEEGYQAPESSGGIPLWTLAPAAALAGLLGLLGLADLYRSRRNGNG